MSGWRTSRCAEAREALWPRDLPREHTEAIERANRHLERCSSCRSFFERDAAVAQAVRRCLGTVVAPRELRERVYDALARERALRASSEPAGEARRAGGRAGATRARGRLAAGAALLVVMLITTLLVLDRPGAESAYARDFASRAVEADAVETTNPTAITRFFMRELGVGVPPVTLAEAELSRAMICLIRGDRAAMVEYDWQGHIVAHYRLPLNGSVRTAAGRLSAERPRLRTAVERGVSVVRWEDGQFEHAVVSEVGTDDLRRLVESGFLAR